MSDGVNGWAGAAPQGDGALGIAAVARELGVSMSALRRWERRYGVVVAGRVNGRRVYEPEQLLVLARIVAEIRAGASVEDAHTTAAASHLPRTLRMRLDPSPEAPTAARWAVDELLEGDADERFAFDLRLVASEAVKHAVLHGSSRERIELELRLLEDRAELKVRNGGSPVSLKALRAKRRDEGQGLKIVDAVSDTWSIESDPSGTEISARVSKRDE
jgi:DNA-binding transcriptional MerR regulator